MLLLGEYWWQSNALCSFFWKQIELAISTLVEYFTTKTTPKRSTYEQKNHQCLHLRWSGLDSHHNMAQVAFRWFCQLKLPQQVALTEFSSQVNAQVGVIIVTCRKVDDPDDVASSVMSPHCSGCSPRDPPALNLNEATPTPLHLLCREVSTVLIMADNESQILYILSKQSQ